MANVNIGWNFPIDESESPIGLNRGGVETFKDKIMFSLAKETCQNSLDARHKESEPVIVELKEFSISQKEFPDLSNFRAMIDKQIEYWSGLSHDKTNLDFFKEAEKIINNGSITCLRVSDFNTTGLSLEGDFSGWNKLVKAEGVSDNESTAGGSFGLGHFVSFACSRLYTVIYSTKNLKKSMAHQGVARLSSFRTNEGKLASGIGYYGDNYTYLNNMVNLDKKFSRKDPGTDIYIMGFENRDLGWELQIIGSVIDTFMNSIYNGDLIFKLNGHILNKDTLEGFIKKCEKDLNPYTLNYYEILTEKYPVHKFYETFFEKNDVELSISFSPQMKRRIAMIRNNGMKIFDKDRLPNLGHYSGIFLLKGKKINEYFRLLENPQHSGWAIDRAKNKIEAKTKRDNITRFITKSVLSLIKEMHPDSFDAEGAGEYLPDEDNDLGERDEMETTDPQLEENDEIVIEPRVSNSSNSINIVTGDGGPGEGGNGGGDDSGTSGQGEDEGDSGKKQIEVEGTRIFADKDKMYHLKFLVPNKIKSLDINLEINGEQGNEPLEIISAEEIIKKSSKTKQLKSKRNVIYLDSLTSLESVEVIFKTKEKEILSLEVKYYAN